MIDHSLENELQSLRLALREQTDRAARLEAELERTRLSARDTTSESVAQAVERLLAAAANPAAQLLAQEYLIQALARPVSAQDVLHVARRLIDALQAAGLEWIGAAGQPAEFDPARHMPLRAGVELEPGQAVTVRLAGASYLGKVLRKASVEGAL